MDDLRVANRRTRGIEARVDAGTLPRSANGPTWAGPGSGHTCAGCTERIDRTDTLRFHLECFTEGSKVMEARRGIVAL